MSLRFYRWRDNQGQMTMVAVVAPLFFFAVFALQNGWSTATTVGGLVLLLISALLCWRFWLLKQEEIELTANRTLIIHKRGRFAKPLTSTFSLDGFGSVRSYLTTGTRRINRLELVTITGGESLLIASRSPSKPSTFWRLAGESLESSEIFKLRIELASKWGLPDDGFHGIKWVGATIKGSE